MKILYMQRKPEQNDLSKPSILQDCGISNCFLRFANSISDYSTLTTAVHQHTSHEIHLILEGAQHYRVLDTSYHIPAGHFILIPANAPHQYVSTTPGSRKFTISFSSVPGKNGVADFFTNKLLCKTVPPNALDALNNIVAESAYHREYSAALIESKLLQFLVYLARDAGICEAQATGTESKDPRVQLAQQYIADNIDHIPGCSDVADYCHLSQKQLSRLFVQALHITPANYIRSQRMLRIKQLLTETDDSLEQISEQLHFANVYHFNNFFSKYGGIAPGKYRKMHTKAGL